MSSSSHVLVIQYFLLWSLQTVSSKHEKNEFVGCHIDSRNNRVLQGHVEVWPDSLTKPRCIDLCYRMGYAYAGLEVGVECFCGNNKLSAYYLPQSDCNYTCPGDSSAHECGGHWRIAIYKTDFPKNNTFVGCYKDSKDNRLLTGYRGQWSSDMTKQNCISHCFRSGYLYAGLEASIECFCGDEKPMGHQLSPNDCKFECSGNRVPECGGNWIAAIYKTEIPNESIEGKYVGCFKNEEDTDVLNRYHVTLAKTNSPHRCFNICIKLGFTYAGVENGNKCHCGVSRPPGSPVGEEQCNSQCSGDSSAKCGGVKAISVYSTEDQSGKHEKNEFVGCHIDSRNNRVLQGHVEVWPDSLTKPRCIDLCYRMGYAYAGLEVGVECFCGNNKLSAYYLSKSDCNYTCPGDSSAHECGGHWRIAIYKTDFPKNNTFVGCYKDSKDNRLLTGYRGKWSSDLTKQNCISHCFRSGFLYAGLEASIECFCGDEKPIGHQLSPNDCKYECSGNRAPECGGNGIAAIYKTEIPNESIEGKYVGCFKNEEDTDVLNRYHVTLAKTNSPHRCFNICIKLGFTYAGVENGNKCHCGVSRPPGSPVGEEQCNSQCSGDSSAKCGGVKAISVYSTEDQSGKHEKNEFVGCHIDSRNNRVLQGHVEVWPDSLTKPRCIDLCYRMGYAYAGLEVGVECFCGNNKLSAYYLSKSDCNYTCPGDSSPHECGGHWRIAIYKTDFPKNNTFVGCYKDSKDNRLLTGYRGKWSSDLTKQNCISHCFRSGFLYAGLEASIECFCGDEKPIGHQLSPNDCKYECSGNRAPECGGNGIAAIYKTEIPNESIEGKYVGCFKNEEDTDVLNRYHVTLAKTNSPHRCFNICIKLGFTYAGVENGNKCHCGVSHPPGSPVGEDQCNSQCSGDSSAKCGGIKAISVYSTEDQSGINEKNEFVGCHSDSRNNRVLQGHVEVWPDSLTKPRCIDLCYRMGYAYAGLEVGVECFCGNNKLAAYYLPQSDCNYTCPGDSSAHECGGHWRIAIYKTDFPKNNTFVGCYKDSQDNRLLTGYKGQWSSDMTKQNCISHCFRSGFLYAGLEASIECFCGDEKPMGHQLSPNDCKYECSGNRAPECGGNWIAAIYKTEIPNESIEGKYVGCFKNEEDTNILNRYHVTLAKTNSPHRCFNICIKLGFTYAGVENGNKCHCGVSRPPGSPVGEDQCNSQCSGDLSAKCGGSKVISVYSTEDQSDSVGQENKFLGCYPDSSEKRILTGHKALWPDSLTKKSCLDLCYRMGFLHAALEVSVECFCGNERPWRYQFDPSDCNYTCSGDESSHICGGNWKAAVYETNFPEDNEFMGCYSDSANDRKLTGTKEQWSNNLTKVDCISHCFRLGYLYAGLEAGIECFCGDEKPIGYHLSQDDCRAKCSGNDKEECGGNWRIAVYKTEIPDKPDTGRYIGCFRDSGRRKLLNRHRIVLEKTNSPRRCLNICAKLGFSYSGVENGNECHCGVSRPLGAPLTESDCDIECPGDEAEKCGANQAIRVYRTDNKEDVDPLLGYFIKPETEDGATFTAPAASSSPVITAKSVNCDLSVTTVNGRPACKGKLVFNELFDSPLSDNVWKYVIQFATAPDYEFVLYRSSPDNINVNKGRLMIKPVLQSDREVTEEKLDLGTRCTGKAGTNECVNKPWAYMILPPVTSAKITTSRYFNFRYGKVEIRAKFPVGDWIVPELLLEPKYSEYGPGYRSGRIRIAMVRGNKQLSCEGRNVENELTCEALASASLYTVKSLSVKPAEDDDWKGKFHVYTLTWTPDKISFSVDKQPEQTLISNTGLVSKMLGFNYDEQRTWQFGSRIAPFDKEFYISVGLAVGGIRDFSDSCSNKPWKNFEPKQVLHFWQAKNDWLATWDSPILEIDHIKVTAL